ncbi:hypothetical protein [Nocardia sp. NPDC050175]|uniref:hypothetical protein n=1 Tax=Nocardia sp. NPDC050175 TaxID=3364317 RepID=UPI0037AB70D0
MDRELAEQLVAVEDAGATDDFAGAVGPTPEGYTLETYLLLSVIDALQGVQAAVIAAAGADPPSVNPMPRPMTALDQLREERRLRSMQKLIDEFTTPVPDD